MRRILLLSLFALLFANTSLLAQQVPTPMPPLPPMIMPPYDYDWMPDCSNEGAPLPPGVVNLHRTTTDNVGMPWLTNSPWDTRRGYQGFKENPTDVVMHTVTGVDYVTTVYVLLPGQVYLDDVTRTATYAGDGNRGGGRIMIVKRNRATNAILWQKFVDDGLGACSIPRIHVGLNNCYTVTYKHLSVTPAQMETQIRAAQIDFATGAILQSISLSNTTTYSDIYEYDVDSDPNYGFAVVATVPTGNFDPNGFPIVKIVAQHVDLWWGPTWNAPDFFVVNTGVTALGTGNTSSYKWNPIIRWNSVHNKYQMVWADKFLTPNIIQVQAMAPGSTALTYMSGGGALFGLTLNPFQEFYMEPCKGHVAGFVDVGISFFLYNDQLLQTKLKGVMLNGTTGVLADNSPNIAGQPMALYPFPQSGTVDNPLAMYMNNNNQVTMRMGDVTNVLPTGFWTSSGATAPTSARYASFLSSNASGIWTVIPDIGREIMYRVTTGGVWSAANLVNVRMTGPLLLTPSTDVYFSAALNATHLTVSQYEDGFTRSIQHDYVHEFHPEVSEHVREEYFKFASYSFDHYPVTGVLPYFGAASSGDYETYKLHFNAHTSLLDNERATVYEDWRFDGIDLKMMYKNPSSGVDMHLPFAISTPTIMYSRPKVAVSYDANINGYIAIITYMKTNESTVQAFYCYQVRDLQTGGIITAETVIDNGIIGVGGALTSFLNAAVVHDVAQNCHLFIYRKEASPSNFELRTAGFAADGTLLPWLANPKTFVAPTVSKQSQIRACANPDGTGGVSSGAYVTWLADMTPVDKVYLSAVRTVTGDPWIAGSLQHTPFLTTNDPAHPVVTADANCVFVAWKDEQAIASDNRIYGTAWTNTGALMPGGWTANGLNLTSTIPSPYNLPNRYDADMPDVAMLPGTFQPIVAVVFNESNATLLTYPQRIGCLTVNLSTMAIGGQSNFAFPARNYPPTMTSSDAVEAMHGFYQRKPKIIAMPAPTTVWDGYPTPYPYVMCAFETQAYPINNPAYVFFRNMENTRTPAPDPAHVENNIVSVLYHPMTGHVVSKFSLARKSGAQDLDQLLYTSDQGFVAAYTDFGGGRNDAGIVKVVDIEEDIRDHHYFENDPSLTPNEYGLLWTSYGQTQTFRLYNNSIIDLVINLSAISISAQIPSPYVTWQLNGLTGSGEATISGDEIGTTRDYNASMTYYPGGPMTTNDDDVEVHVYPHQFSMPLFYKRMPIMGPANPMVPGDGIGQYKSAFGNSQQSNRELDLTIAENPTKDRLGIRIRGTNDREVTLRLLDMLGREVLNFEPRMLTGEIMEITASVAELPSGQYMLVASDNANNREQMLLSVQH